MQILLSYRCKEHASSGGGVLQSAEVGHRNIGGLWA